MKEHDKKYPLFDPGMDIWEHMMAEFDDKGKSQMGNQVAHHMIPVQRINDGWLLTRADYARGEGWRNGKPKIMLVEWDGKLTYDYAPDTKEKSE